jgi:hypothetical protein
MSEFRTDRLNSSSVRGKVPGMRMSDRNWYVTLLIAELAVIGLVIAIFSSVESRLMAGRLAGTIFTGLGVAIVIGSWKRGSAKSGAFALGAVHLFLISLPLMISRWMQSEVDFGLVRVLGLPGPVFHRLSTAVYFCLLAATVFDLVRVFLRSRLTNDIRK